MSKEDIDYSIPRHNLNKKEKEEADTGLLQLRLDHLRNMSDEQKKYSSLISLKFQIIDYLETRVFSQEFTFASFLIRYVAILNISRRKLASDLGIHETKFSRLINDKENPGIGILYRIEEHSNSLLPASMTWQLVTRKLTMEIENNKKEKMKQSKLVKNKLNFKIAQSL